MIAYAALFFAAFLAATIFPAQSEAVAVAMLAGDYAPLSVIVVASLGNVLGAMTTWALGYWAEAVPALLARWGVMRDPRELPDLSRAKQWYHRWGRLSLLASWLPLIGDGLVLVAGILREPALPVLILVTIAKAGRYTVLAIITLKLIG
jgi:membrane protein YqaA with SNARE-associated domain